MVYPMLIHYAQHLFKVKRVLAVKINKYNNTTYHILVDDE